MENFVKVVLTGPTIRKIGKGLEMPLRVFAVKTDKPTEGRLPVRKRSTVGGSGNSRIQKANWYISIR